jgi:hypothetical protein
VFKGKATSGYKISEQKYLDTPEEVLEKLTASQGNQLEAHMLPVPLLSQSVTLGYKLSQS